MILKSLSLSLSLSKIFESDFKNEKTQRLAKNLRIPTDRPDSMYVICFEYITIIYYIEPWYNIYMLSLELLFSIHNIIVLVLSVCSSQSIKI